MRKRKPIFYPDVDYSPLCDKERDLKACRELYAIFYLNYDKGLTDVDIGEYARYMKMTGYNGITLDCIVRANLTRWHTEVRKVLGNEAIRWCKREKLPGETKGRYHLHPQFLEKIPSLLNKHKKKEAQNDSSSSENLQPMIGLMVGPNEDISMKNMKMEDTSHVNDSCDEPADDSWLSSLFSFDGPPGDGSTYGRDHEDHDSDLDFPMGSDSDLDFPKADDDSDMDLDFPSCKSDYDSDLDFPR